MKANLQLAGPAAICLLASAAQGADYQVMRSVSLSAPGWEVWNAIGDFCDFDDWNDDVSGCKLRVIDGRLHRVLTMLNGNDRVEQLLSVEGGLSYTYSVAEWEMPIERFTATLSIEPGDATIVTWSARFSSDNPEMEDAVLRHIEAGLASIANMVEM